MFRPSTVGRRRVGFTLVELLVVIAIIGILIALLLPAVQAAREAARRSQCSNNMKQMGIAFHNYHDSFKSFPMAFYMAWADPAAFSLNAKSWGTMLLPYMEQQSLYDQFDHNYAACVPPYGSTANIAVISTPVAGFICPSAPGGIDRVYNGSGALDAATDPSLAAFAGVTWTAAPSDYMATETIRASFRRLSGDTTLGEAQGVLQEHMNIPPLNVGDNRESSFARVTDGTSNTFIVGERTGGNKIYNKRMEVDFSGFPYPADVIRAGNGGGWGDILNGECDFHGALYSGIDTSLSEGSCAINCTNAREFGYHSFHPGGAMFGMVDGSVQFVSETVTPAIFSARFTRDGGETVSN